MALEADVDVDRGEMGCECECSLWVLPRKYGYDFAFDLVLPTDAAGDAEAVDGSGMWYIDKKRSFVVSLFIDGRQSSS